jgi:hypothetical protein
LRRERSGRKLPEGIQREGNPNLNFPWFFVNFMSWRIVLVSPQINEVLNIGCELKINELIEIKMECNYVEMAYSYLTKYVFQKNNKENGNNNKYIKVHEIMNSYGVVKQYINVEEMKREGILNDVCDKLEVSVLLKPLSSEVLNEEIRKYKENQ